MQIQSNDQLSEAAMRTVESATSSTSTSTINKQTKFQSVVERRKQRSF